MPEPEMVSAQRRRLSEIRDEMRSLAQEARAIHAYLSAFAETPSGGLDEEVLAQLLGSSRPQHPERASSDAVASPAKGGRNSLRDRALAAIGPGEAVSVTIVHERLTARGEVGSELDQRAVANALGGLRRTGRLRQVSRGVYALPADPDQEEDRPVEQARQQTAPREVRGGDGLGNPPGQHDGDQGDAAGSRPWDARPERNDVYGEKSPFEEDEPF